MWQITPNDFQPHVAGALASVLLFALAPGGLAQPARAQDAPPREAAAAAPLTAQAATNPPDPEPCRELVAANNTPGTLPSNIPVFLAPGEKDGLVKPEVTFDDRRRLCRAGSGMRLLVLPDANHGIVARDSTGAAVDWMAARFADQPPPSDCISGSRG